MTVEGVGSGVCGGGFGLVFSGGSGRWWLVSGRGVGGRSLAAVVCLPGFGWVAVVFGRVSLRRVAAGVGAAEIFFFQGLIGILWWSAELEG